MSDYFLLKMTKNRMCMVNRAMLFYTLFIIVGTIFLRNTSSSRKSCVNGFLLSVFVVLMWKILSIKITIKNYRFYEKQTPTHIFVLNHFSCQSLKQFICRLSLSCLNWSLFGWSDVFFSYSSI